MTTARQAQRLRITKFAECLIRPGAATSPLHCRQKASAYFIPYASIGGISPLFDNLHEIIKGWIKDSPLIYISEWDIMFNKDTFEHLSSIEERDKEVKLGTTMVSLTHNGKEVRGKIFKESDWDTHSARVV